jgi:hypothetical protein
MTQAPSEVETVRSKRQAGKAGHGEVKYCVFVKFLCKQSLRLREFCCMVGCPDGCIVGWPVGLLMAGRGRGCMELPMAHGVPRLSIVSQRHQGPAGWIARLGSQQGCGK